MVEAVFMMGGLGLVIGMGLALASKVFYVYVDPMILKIDDLLPGANCGGCGYAGCSANAEAVVAGKAAPDSCVAGGADLAEAIADALGLTVEAKEPDIAKLDCTYGPDGAAIKYKYNGLSDCQAMALLYGGMKVCGIGCIGLGSCIKACPFGAIKMGDNGLPVVDEILCTGCGTCERVCPKNIIKLSSVTRRILQEYTTDDCVTPCQGACPAGINISEYIRQIAIGDYHQAVSVIKERNPFPAIIGRICPRPCETQCRRNLIDEPVAINFLKRFAADYEKENNKRIQPFRAPETNRKIAIIGGGAQGLSTAFFAARLGHAPTVFEAEAKLGGLLRKAIAQYRLPYDILDWDIDGVHDMGVKTLTHQALGRDFTLASLFKDGFETVFMASGGWDSRIGRGPDNAEKAVEEPIPGTFLLIDIIKTGLDNHKNLSLNSNIVIVEGGKLTIEAAKICGHLGAKNITVMFRNARDNSPLDESEIKQLENKGVNIVFNASITRLAGQDNLLEEVTYTDVETESEQALDADTLVLAAGRFPEMIFKPIKPEDPETDEEQTPVHPNEPIRWEGIQPYKDPAYSEEMGLLAKGDTITDFSAAIRAIAAGRRAAASIHKIMYDIDLDLPGNVIARNTVIQRVDILENITASTRQIMPLCRMEDVSETNPEIEKGFNEEMAKTEANRCLQCGLICYADQSGN